MIYNYKALRYFIEKLLLQFGPLGQLNVMILVPNFPNQMVKERLKQELLAIGVGKVFVEDRIQAISFYLQKIDRLDIERYVLLDLVEDKSTFASFTPNKLFIRMSDVYINQTIKESFYEKFKMILSNSTVEYLKDNFCSALPERQKERKIKVKGIEIKTGLPIYLNISTTFLNEITNKKMDKFICFLKDFIKSLPTCAQDLIKEYGVILMDDGSLFKQLNLALENKMGLPVLSPAKQLDCAVIGGFKKLNLLVNEK